MRRPDIRASAFAFLVDEFSYRHVGTELRDRGFRIRYADPVVGVHLDWFLGDPFWVFLVRLVDGEFPPRRDIRPDSGIDYIDLATVEDLVGQESDVYRGDFSPLPDDQRAQAVARSLRACGGPILNGDLQQWGALEDRVKERFREDIIKNGGVDLARRLGWL